MRRVVRLYARLLRLLPPAVRRADGDEMVSTFAAQLTNAAARRERAGVMARTFARLPAVIMAEWFDRVLDDASSPTRRRAGIRAIDRLAQMCRHGARSLGRSPAFVWSTVLLLALGVGAVTTVFTLVDHVMLRPLPYSAADRLFEVQDGDHSGPLWRGMQALRSVEMWSATQTDEVNLTGVGQPEELQAARVTRDFFAMFGARPAIGRLLAADDFESADRVVLSPAFWERTFGGDPAVIGRTIVIDGQPQVVIGVMDRSFAPPEALVGSDPDLWRAMDWANPRFQDHGSHVLDVAGRLTPDAALGAVQAELDALVARLAAEVPPDQQDYVDRQGNLRKRRVATLKDTTTGADVREGLGLLFGAVTLLLLVACANVAHLFMARGLARMNEMQLRRTLGAPTHVLAGQLLVESMMVGLAGAALGVLFARTGLAAFMALIPEALPRADAIRIDMRVMGFAAAAGALTALVFGMLPALRLVGRDVGGALRGRGRGISDGRTDARLRAALVVAEVALSVILVVHAGSLLRAFVGLNAEELGFRTEGVWTLPLKVNDVEIAADWSRRMDAVRDALGAVPDVSMATYGETIPLQFSGGSHCCWRADLRFVGTSTPDVSTNMHMVDADYFALLELELLAGRPWSRHDARAQPAPAVVSEQLAIQVYGSASAAVGQQFAVAEGEFYIVGVVSNNRHYGPDQDHRPAAYIPAPAIPYATRNAHMAVRVDGATAGLAGRLREAVWSVEPDLPVPIIRPLTAWAGEATAQARFTTALFATFGAVALLLMAGGLYGTLLYGVGRKRRELGIRLALGDAPGRLQRRVIGRGIATAVIGCLFGAAGAWGVGRVLANRVSGLEFGQPATLVSAIGILLVVALAASWLPARRAARTDPLEALRAE